MDINTATRRFTVFADLTAAELKKLRSFDGPIINYVRGEAIQSEGDTKPQVYLLHEGWTATSICVADGGRQLVKVHLPGDLLGTPSMALERAGESLIALTPAKVSIVSPDFLRDLFEGAPRLAALLFLISQEERVVAMDRLATVGRTNSAGRLAALILELHTRVMRQRRQESTFECPLSQQDAGDLIGMTNVHVSRALRVLRDRDIANWSHGHIAIIDESALRTLAGIETRRILRNPAWLPSG